MNRWLRTPPKSVRDARLLVTAAFRAAVCWWKFGRKAELPWRRGIPAVALVALALFILPGAALAHERRTIANGKYDVVVGRDIEPTYANLKNAASIRIMQAGAGTPVTGAEKH